MTDLSITRATPADLDDLVPLFDAYRGFYGKPTDQAGGRAFLAERMAKDESVVFIARLNGNGSGFMQLYPLYSSTRMARLWLLNDLFVAETARGRGIGEALLARARAHAESTGACELMLETAADNPAQRLYERVGYRRLGDYLFYSLVLDGGSHY